MGWPSRSDCPWIPLARGRCEIPNPEAAAHPDQFASAPPAGSWDFLTRLAAAVSAVSPAPVILDRCVTYQTARVHAWLTAHPRGRALPRHALHVPFPAWMNAGARIPQRSLRLTGVDSTSCKQSPDMPPGKPANQCHRAGYTLSGLSSDCVARCTAFSRFRRQPRPQ